ncbi:hypothetical protein Ae505Ps2_5889c [Pseudonocardia sp. Ae505_Ps2]|nr:hypothetical protein Ae505Ps2_5889c [Pseudonocardia sp. Ae505_Ps2]
MRAGPTPPVRVGHRTTAAGPAAARTLARLQPHLLRTRTRKQHERSPLPRPAGRRPALARARWEGSECGSHSAGRTALPAVRGRPPGARGFDRPPRGVADMPASATRPGARPGLGAIPSGLSRPAHAPEIAHRIEWVGRRPAPPRSGNVRGNWVSRFRAASTQRTRTRAAARQDAGTPGSSTPPGTGRAADASTGPGDVGSPLELLSTPLDASRLTGPTSKPPSPEWRACELCTAT